MAAQSDAHRSKKLLKFKDEKAYLHEDGMNLLRKLPGYVYPVILMGDGRAGKSFLASKILKLEGVFTSSDSAEAVTEGIDCFLYPMHKLNPEGFPNKDAHMLVLDCEGGNNAMAAIRTLVNVFGIVLGTELIFVASGKCSEDSLQNLGTSLLARSLIASDKEHTLNEQRLVFIVNKTTLKSNPDTLEQALKTKQTDPGRQEARDIIRKHFTSRNFFDVPFSGTPDFDKAIKKVEQAIVKDYRPLTMGGQKVKRKQLLIMLETTVKQMNSVNEVSMPSMTRAVIMDGFLTPLVDKLLKEAEENMPKVEDYCENLNEKDPLPGILAKFDEEASQLKGNPLYKEARKNLSDKIGEEWEKIVSQNDVYGTLTKFTTVETRDCGTTEKRVALGGQGILRDVLLAQQFVTVEQRSVIVLKNGTRKEEPWSPNGETKTIILEKAFQQMRSVPHLMGKLQKQNPNPLVVAVGQKYQLRNICVKEGHFMWWDSSRVRGEDDRVNGCINLLVNTAQVVTNPDDEHSFGLKPASEEGWQDSSCFSGGQLREFWFSVKDTDFSRAQWEDAVKRNIKFAEEAMEQLGKELVAKFIPMEKPTLKTVQWRC